MRVEVPDPFEVRETLAGLTEAVMPTGNTAVARDTLPVNPPRLFSVIVEVPDWPAKIVTLVAPVETEKSTTLTDAWTEWMTEPLVAVIVRV